MSKRLPNAGKEPTQCWGKIKMWNKDGKDGIVDSSRDQRCPRNKRANVQIIVMNEGVNHSPRRDSREVSLHRCSARGLRRGLGAEVASPLPGLSGSRLGTGSGGAFAVVWVPGLWEWDGKPVLMLRYWVRTPSGCRLWDLRLRQGRCPISLEPSHPCDDQESRTCAEPA